MILVSMLSYDFVSFSRWVRLLFGREFPMQDLLMLWDAIFSDGIGFDLVDYVFVSMLLYVRDLCKSATSFNQNNYEMALKCYVL